VGLSFLELAERNGRREGGRGGGNNRAVIEDWQ